VGDICKKLALHSVDSQQLGGQVFQLFRALCQAVCLETAVPDDESQNDKYSETDDQF
jgi:hypothetical protein